MSFYWVAQGKGMTDVGRTRSTNQDSLLVDPELQLFVVADGMGGHAGGEIASKLCIESVRNAIANSPLSSTKSWDHPDPKILSALGEAVNKASTKIYERALEEPNLKGMGTTATVLKIADNFAYFAHVGDSRCYLIRCGLAYQMTNDHSLVSEQVRAGLMTREEAELHHLRNVITRSVGYQEEEDVDTAYLELEDNDIFVLCSDGLHGKVADREITQIAQNFGTHAVKQLIDLANARGGDDNITAIVVKISRVSSRSADHESSTAPK
jgi:protein phosphatase